MKLAPGVTKMLTLASFEQTTFAISRFARRILSHRRTMFNETHPLRLDFLSECFQDKPLVNPLRGGEQTALILRKFAASSGVTNGSLSSAAFTVLLHFNPFSQSESLTLNMALRMCRSCMVLAGVSAAMRVSVTGVERCAV
jgi:hypothetical protein